MKPEYHLLLIVAIVAAYFWLDHPISTYLFHLSREVEWAWTWHVSGFISSLGAGNLWLAVFGAMLARQMICGRKLRIDWALLPVKGLIAIAISGLTVRVVKLIASRPRPSRFFNEGLSGFHWSFEPGFSSFPSGHAVTITCVMLCIAKTYPRFRSWCYAVIVLIACMRVISNKHYLSDVLAGCYIGGIIAYFLWKYLPHNRGTNDLHTRADRPSERGQIDAV